MNADKTRFAVLMDAGAVFFAVRDLYEGLQLEYPKLADLLCQRALIHPPDPRRRNDESAVWAMWTSFHPQNTGQAKFIDYAEQSLGWIVRRFPPSESYILDPQGVLSVTAAEGRGNRMTNRLVRFDASIAYTIGRIAATHQIILVTDSFTLAEPLIRAARLRKGSNTIAFFGRLLDPRWQPVIRNAPHAMVKFVDFDEFDGILFGTKKPTMKQTWEEDFPVG